MGKRFLRAGTANGNEAEIKDNAFAGMRAEGFEKEARVV